MFECGCRGLGCDDCIAAELTKNPLSFSDCPFGLMGCEGNHNEAENCQFEAVYLFKVVIQRGTADNVIGLMFDDEFFALVGRVSPIVVYMRMTGREANDLMTFNSDIEIQRAKEDWSI